MLCAACAAGLRPLHRSCPGCALPLPEGLPPLSRCGVCQRQASPVEAAWAAYRYVDPLAKLLLNLKFHGDLAVAATLGRYLAEQSCPLDLGSVDYLIPAPLHHSRLRQRGFNQALELCRPLARRHHLEIRQDVLLRSRATQEQSRLDARQRRRNVRKAFVCRSRLDGEHVLLFDDVMTTGATLHAMARTLKAAGAGHISAMAVARAC